MKKKAVCISLLAIMALCGAAFSQAAPEKTEPVPVEYGQTIIGSWKFDLGGGFTASIEYKADGTFEQKVDRLVIKGKYELTGNKLKTVTKGQTTQFTIVSFENNKLTIKRDKDGRVIVYQKH